MDNFAIVDPVRVLHAYYKQTSETKTHYEQEQLLGGSLEHVLHQCALL